MSVQDQIAELRKKAENKALPESAKNAVLKKIADLEAQIKTEEKESEKPEKTEKHEKSEKHEVKTPEEVIAKFDAPVDVKKLLLEIDGEHYQLRKKAKHDTDKAAAGTRKYSDSMIKEHDAKYESRLGNAMRPVTVELKNRSEGSKKHSEEIRIAESINNSLVVIASAVDRTLMKFDDETGETLEKGLKAIALASVPDGNLTEHYAVRPKTAHALQQLNILEVEWSGKVGDSKVVNAKLSDVAKSAKSEIKQSSKQLVEAIKFAKGGMVTKNGITYKDKSIYDVKVGDKMLVNAFPNVWKSGIKSYKPATVYDGIVLPITEVSVIGAVFKSGTDRIEYNHYDRYLYQTVSVVVD